MNRKYPDVKLKLIGEDTCKSLIIKVMKNY